MIFLFIMFLILTLICFIFYEKDNPFWAFGIIVCGVPSFALFTIAHYTIKIESHKEPVTIEHIHQTENSIFLLYEDSAMKVTDPFKIKLIKSDPESISLVKPVGENHFGNIITNDVKLIVNKTK
jgi:hypothetical protein